MPAVLLPGIAGAANELLAELQAIAQARPKDTEAAGRVGMYYHAHELHDEALRWYGVASSLNPDDARWWQLSGLALSEMARAQEALGPLRKAHELAPEREAVVVKLAQILSTLGLLEEAVGVLEAGLIDHPFSGAMLAELGVLMLASGDFEKAINYLQSALNADPAADRLYYPLSNALRARGNKDAARKAAALAGPTAPRIADPVADAMRSLSQSYSFYMSQGLLAANNGDWPAARRLLQRAASENPADPTVGVNLARVMESMGENEASQGELERVLAISPEHAPAFFNLGVLAELAGDDQLALQRYGEALTLDPQDFRSRLLAASAALRLNRHDVAAEHYVAAAQLRPERDELLVRQAVSQWRNNCAAAVATALQLVQRRPEDPAALVLYVRVVSTCPTAPGQAFVNALNAARNLLRLDPSPIMQVNLAMAEAASGNFEEARELHRKAMAALDGELTVAQHTALDLLGQRYQSELPANQPFILNEQVLNPPRLTPADRR